MGNNNKTFQTNKFHSLEILKFSHKRFKDGHPPADVVRSNKEEESLFSFIQTSRQLKKEESTKKYTWNFFFSFFLLITQEKEKTFPSSFSWQGLFCSEINVSKHGLASKLFSS